MNRQRPTTQICGLSVPQFILELIDAGRWRMPADTIVLATMFPGFAPQDDIAGPRLYTVEEMQRETVSWLQTIRSPREFDLDVNCNPAVSFPPERLILIGDVGIGWDSPIALDYSTSETNPRVIHLVWLSGKPEWKPVAPDVEAFVSRLTL